MNRTRAKAPKKQCQDCGEKVGKLYNDPGDPPLDTEPCLCASCVETAIDERIEELQGEIDSLEASRPGASK